MSRIRQVGLGLFLPRHTHHQNNGNVQSLKNHLFLGNGFQSKTIIYFTNILKNLSGFKAANQNWNAISDSSTSLFRLLHCGLSKVPTSLKKHSNNIVRMCAQQCECVIAHKIRRSQQIISLYSNLWDEMAFKQLLKRFQQQMCRRGRLYMLSAAGVSAFDWNKHRISEEELFGHLNEMEYIYSLVRCTMTCDQCDQRQVVNSPITSVVYCKCKQVTPSWKKTVDDWMPFIEGEDMLIWKKESKEHPGMISYKVFGSYDDVTAEDFLQVQMDVEHRKEWDPTAVQLNIVDQDPDSNSDVVYWEMEWPRLFSNRDYVFKRRFILDSQRKVMVIVSRGITHPDCPETSDRFRVKDYWSFMVIRPYTDFDQPGIEFGLTYFDNPGIAIPSAVTAWVAMSGLPNFLMQLRDAAREVGRMRVLNAATTGVAVPQPATEPLVTPPTQSSPLPSQESQNIQLSQNNNTDTYFQQFRVLFI